MRVSGRGEAQAGNKDTGCEGRTAPTQSPSARNWAARASSPLGLLLAPDLFLKAEAQSSELSLRLRRKCSQGQSAWSVEGQEKGKDGRRGTAQAARSVQYTPRFRLLLFTEEPNNILEMRLSGNATPSGARAPYMPTSSRVLPLPVLPMPGGHPPSKAHSCLGCVATPVWPSTAGAEGADCAQRQCLLSSL